jgi:acetyl-CoA carboxylase biotin carboxyl carrier protein
VEIEQIRKIIELMQEHDLSYFDLTTAEGVHLRLKKGTDLETLRGALASAPVYAAPVAAAAAVAAPPVPAIAAGSEITSPMVGTYYSKPAPDAAPFVNVGDAISVGQTICIIEAMKVMNEIKAEQSGIVTAIVAEDGHPVQFGDVLLRIS